MKPETTLGKKRVACEAPTSLARGKRIKAVRATTSSVSRPLLPLAQATRTSSRLFQPSTSNTIGYDVFEAFYLSRECDCWNCERDMMMAESMGMETLYNAFLVAPPHYFGCVRLWAGDVVYETDPDEM